MNKIHVKVYVTKKVRTPPINVVYGSTGVGIEMEVMDYDLPADSTAEARATGKFTTAVYRNSCTVDGNIITMYPEPGFFVPGGNEFQVVITAEGKTILSFVMDAICDKNLGEGNDPAKPEQVIPLVQRAEAAAQIAESRGEILERIVVTGKNIINPESVNCLDGAYVLYVSGEILANEIMKTVVLPVFGGQKIAFNHVFKYCHVSCFGDRIALKNYAVGDTVPGYLGGFGNIDGESYTWVVPDGARSLVVSFPVAMAGEIMAEYGESVTDYEPYREGIDPDSVNGVIVCGKGRRFETIGAACEAAMDGDIIYVMPGVYHESVICLDKMLHIQGHNRDSVVLENDSGRYDQPPLYIAMGSVEDITILESSTEMVGNPANSPAYCVHIDSNTQEGKALSFKNVRFRNKIAACVGIGLRKDFRLSFVNCDFVAESYPAVYLHESNNPDSENTNQFAEFIDCSIATMAEKPAILMQETPGMGGDAAVLYQRCILRNQGGDIILMRQNNAQTQALDGDGYLGSHIWVLDGRSAGNNYAIINAVPETDASLEKTGVAADAAAVGTAIGDLDRKKVDAETGKGLSTNDYDATAKKKVDTIPEDPKYTDTVTPVDATLSIDGEAADAKATGNALNQIKGNLSTLETRLKSGLIADSELHLGFYLDADGDLCQKED